MPECFLTFGSFPRVEISDLPAVARNGYITFGSFNNLQKLNDGTIRLWSSILKEIPGSKICLKEYAFEHELVRQNIYSMFSNYGIEKGDVILKSWEISFEDHLSAYNEVDIALDPFPYNGTTTTCEALWMGVPVVTIVGKMHAQRVSYSILKNIGHEELAAKSEKEYIDIACRLATDLDSLGALKKRLPDDLSNSILCKPERFTGQLEQVYLGVWENYSN